MATKVLLHPIGSKKSVKFFNKINKRKKQVIQWLKPKPIFGDVFFTPKNWDFPTLIQHAEGGVSLTELKTATVQEPWTERAMWKTELVKMWIVFCPVCLVCFDVSVLRETNVNIHKMLSQCVFWWFFLKVKCHPFLTCFGYGWFVKLTLTSRIFLHIRNCLRKMQEMLGRQISDRSAVWSHFRMCTYSVHVDGRSKRFQVPNSSLHARLCDLPKQTSNS